MAPHKAPELRRPHGAEGLQRPGPPRARHPGFTADAQSTLEPVEELGETVVGPGGTEQTHCPEKRREERERCAGHTLLPSSDASCRVCTLGGLECVRQDSPGVNAGRPAGKWAVLSAQPPACLLPEAPAGTLPAAALLSRPEPTQGPCSLRLAARTPHRKRRDGPGSVGVLGGPVKGGTEPQPMRATCHRKRPAAPRVLPLPRARVVYVSLQGASVCQGG